MVRYAGLIGVTLLSRGMGPECGTRGWVTGCQVWFSLRVLGRCFICVLGRNAKRAQDYWVVSFPNIMFVFTLFRVAGWCFQFFG